MPKTLCQNNIVIISCVLRRQYQTYQKRHCEVVRKIFNNMLDSIQTAWHTWKRQGKHPHNVYEMELFTESIPSGWILSTQLLTMNHPFLSFSPFSSAVKNFVGRNGENGKYCASYYLFTYLHFSFFFLHHPLERAEATSIFSRLCPLGMFSVTKFHKLATTERVFLISTRTDEDSHPPSSFDLLPNKATRRASESRGSENKSGKILKFHSNYYKLPKFISQKDVYDTCLSLWKLDFHSFLFRTPWGSHDFMIIENKSQTLLLLYGLTASLVLETNINILN